MNMQDLFEAVKLDSLGKRDITSSDIRLSNTGDFYVNDERMKLTQYAASQLFQRFEMPVRYFTKLLDDDPELASYHFNKVQEKFSHDEMLIRVKDREEVPTVRGIMSDLYSVLDNDMVVEGLQAVINKFSDNYQIISYYTCDRRMHVRITFPTTSRQFGFTKDEIGDILQVGVDIVNSEVGFSSLNIASLLWRLVCTNGMRRVSAGETFIQRHIYLDSETFYNNMTFAIHTAIENGILMMKNFAESKKIVLIRPLESIQVVADKYELSDAIVEKAQENWEHDATVYGLINSFTAAARGMNNENRLELERTANKMLTLSPREWGRIDKLAEQYEELL
jgi:hypothetical protein